MNLQVNTFDNTFNCFQLEVDFVCTLQKIWQIILLDNNGKICAEFIHAIYISGSFPLENTANSCTVLVKLSSRVYGEFVDVIYGNTSVSENSSQRFHHHYRMLFCLNCIINSCKY
jgi:hypothetical protein